MEDDDTNEFTRSCDLKHDDDEEDSILVQEEEEEEEVDVFVGIVSSSHSSSTTKTRLVMPVHPVVWPVVRPVVPWRSAPGRASDPALP